MRCPSLGELPAPSCTMTGWPWTEETPPLPPTTPDGKRWPKISIVTPSLNQGAYIEETIRSVLLQGYPNLEYIIVDGGSSDGSVEVIQKYGQWLAYWVNERDHGPSHAVNKGFARASGELFGMMCADDFYCAGAFHKLVLLRFSNPASVASVGSCPEIDINGTVVSHGSPFISNHSRIGDWGSSAWFPSVGCLFDAQAYNRIGGLAESITNANDVDLWLRLSQLGRFLVTNEVVATARFNPNSMSHRDRTSEISALVAINYMRGYPDVSRDILTRYGAEQATTARTHLTAEDHLNSVSFRDIIIALLRRTYSNRITHKIARLFRNFT